LAVVITGKTPWGNESSFFVLKGILERLSEALHLIDSPSLKGAEKGGFHPLRFAEIGCQGPLGIIGELHPSFLEAIEIEQPVFVLEIVLDKLQSLQGEIVAQPIPLYPNSRRDISMIVDEKIPAGKIIERITERGGELVEEVKIFDVYQGSQVPVEKKSLAFAITYRASNRTLTDEEVNTLHEKIQEELRRNFSATLRTS
jgi:phenylalanyl-tRNA synthetase beta chain